MPAVQACRVLVVAALAMSLRAAPPWAHANPQQWSESDLQRILNDSPWALRVGATFPDPREREPIQPQNLPGAAQAGLAGPHGVSDGRWDGGVGNNRGGGALPSVPVLVRWESATPIRQAQLRSHSKLQIPEGDYILSVSGLLPAGQTGGDGALAASSSSDDAKTSAQRTERDLEGLMTGSALLLPASILRPSNVRIDKDSGIILFFFPRKEMIDSKEKNVTFATRYGSLTVRARFRLSEMRYERELSL